RKRNGNTKTPSRKTHRPPATGRRRSRRQQALLYSGARYTRNRARWRRPRLLLGRRVVRLERREPRFRWAEDGTSTLGLSSARRKDRPELSSRRPRSRRKRLRRTRVAAVSPRLLRCVPARSRREQRRGGVPRSGEALLSLDRDRVLRLHSRCCSWPHADLTP